MVRLIVAHSIGDIHPDFLGIVDEEPGTFSGYFCLVEDTNFIFLHTFEKIGRTFVWRAAQFSTPAVNRH